MKPFLHRKKITILLKLALLGVMTTYNIGTVSAQTNKNTASNRCAGKLGVHRTIKVSNKNTTLVGVGNHGRIGLRPKELVLTFDDGPREGTTAKILKTLADECIKATFFSLGRSARVHPNLLRRVAKEGHTIATHSQSHPLLTKRNNDGVRAEIRRGVNSARAALEGTSYKVSNFFRYPFLDRSRRTDTIVREMGLVAFHMNIDSWDWRQQTPEEMVELTLSRARAEGSGIVLFHDIQDKTAAALPSFLKAIKQEGYKIVHVVPGESNFNYREDLIARSKHSAGKKKTSSSFAKSKVKSEKPKTVTKKPSANKIARAPHPKNHPLGGALETPLKPISNRRYIQDLTVTQSPPARQNVPELQPQNEKKKKRFGFFRRIFSKKPKNEAY